ncbi:MAG: ABC transporter permease, partial [Planctomycetota bacterium]
AALGGLCSERGGVVNIALEGLILTGAFAAAAVTLATGSPVLGLVGGVAAGALAGLVHGAACIWLRVDHVVSGIAVNLLADAGTILLLTTLYGSKGGTPQLGDRALASLGPFSPVTLLAFAAIPLVWWLLYRTRWGLRLRACGENPEAADAVGISVDRYRLSGVVVSGALAGLAGVYLAMSAGSFTKHMAAGRGYIALAALVFGRWRPLPVALGCLLFALGQGLQDTLEIDFEIPGQLAKMLPYALTLAVLAAGPLLRRRRASGPPAALGRHYIRG